MKRLSQLMKSNKSKLQIHQAMSVKKFKSRKNSSMYAIDLLNDLAKNDITTIYVAAIVDDFDVQEFINDQSNLVKLEYDDKWYETGEIKPLEDSVKYWNLEDDDIILILY